MELHKKKQVIIGAAAAAVFIALSVILYTPLIRELAAGRAECVKREGETLRARGVIQAARDGRREAAIGTQKDVSQAIDELSKAGRSSGVNFVSMSPQELSEENQDGHKVLPVKIEIESTYEKLAYFLGSLDELDICLVRVKGFTITPQREDAARLSTSLVLDLYIAGE